VTFDEAVSRLRNHANLPESGSPDDSTLFLLWQANRSRTFPSLVRCYVDIMDCLEILNHQWNGRVPSETPNSTKQMVLDRWIVYSVNLIIRGVWQYREEWEKPKVFPEDVLAHLVYFAWAVGCAWDGVLAGDVDSLPEHVLLEARAHGFSETFQ
jgi:hypothetical protein